MLEGDNVDEAEPRRGIAAVETVVRQQCRGRLVRSSVNTSSDTDSAIAGCAIMRANWPPPTMPMRALGWLMFVSPAYPASVLDAVTAEVVRNALSVAAQEAGVVVVKASHSTFIQESADASTAVLDAQGRLIASSTATTLMHSASLRESLRALLIDVPLATMRQGDVFAQNDPFKGGIHANDIAVMRPVFAADGSGPHYFAGTIIHVADIGGGYAGGVAGPHRTCSPKASSFPHCGSTTPVSPNPCCGRFSENNSRTPEKVLGDIRALVSGVNVMARRIENYGAPWRRGPRRLYRRLPALHRDPHAGRVRLLPVGTFRGGFVIDSDGIEPDKTYDVVVEITLPGDGSIHLDFTGTSAQAKGAINASLSQALSGVLFAVRCFVDHTIPMNEGCFTPLVINFPRGTLVNPNPPAACGGRIVTVTAAMEAIVDALSSARPDQALASSGIVHLYAMSGRIRMRHRPGS